MGCPVPILASAHFNPDSEEVNGRPLGPDAAVAGAAAETRAAATGGVSKNERRDATFCGGGDGGVKGAR